MFGWEFPPHISGGLGTACEGLCSGLATLDLELIFVVPHLFGDEEADYMTLVAPGHLPPPAPAPAPTPMDTPTAPPEVVTEKSSVTLTDTTTTASSKTISEIEIYQIESMLSPYLSEVSYSERVRKHQQQTSETETTQRVETSERQVEQQPASASPAALPLDLRLDIGEEEDDAADAQHYGGDLFAEVARYARRAARLVTRLGGDFDLIHAHDWMTYPAAMLASQLTGKPMVLHVHSLEYDRSGDHPHPQIDAIEHQGLHAADRIITVSHYTKSIVRKQHGVAADRISVVHNGITHKKRLRAYHSARPRRADKTVLFLGRVTFQKGPDYFIDAAALVIPHYPNVKFIMAGSGDMLTGLIERVAELGLSRYFHFTGFLRGKQLELMFSIADVYVMPSVSEPFGIAPLEALVRDTPVIISKQSGVSEVLKHALRVDFWDTRRLAELILAVLQYPAIGETMTELGMEELLTLRWDAAAAKVQRIYQEMVGD